MGATRAVIDVGTNSVKLLVAVVEGETVTPLFEDSSQTRLGQGFYETRMLQASAIEKTALAIRDFVEAAQPFAPECVKVFATSAARDAINKEELIQAIRSVAGLDPSVISGDQEADWVFQGVTTDPVFRDQHLLVMDVGGGSTEFVLGRNEHRDFAQSFQIGSVRMLEKFPPADPPTQEDFQRSKEWLDTVIRSQVRPTLEPARQKTNGTLRLVGTGGTTSILARIEHALDNYDRDKIEGVQLSKTQLDRHLQHLWSLTLEERKQIRGLPKKRADVILMGALIYSTVMEVFEFEKLHVSTRGLRFAAVLNCK